MRSHRFSFKWKICHGIRRVYLDTLATFKLKRPSRACTNLKKWLPSHINRSWKLFYLKIGSAKCICFVLGIAYLSAPNIRAFLFPFQQVQIFENEPYRPFPRRPWRSSHSDMFSLDVFWTESNRKTKICRISRICMLRNGSYLLHPFLKEYASILRECDVKKFVFMENASGFNGFHRSASYDLFGSTPARTHIPHFLTDTLLMTYAVELIWPSRYPRRVRRRKLCTEMSTCSTHASDMAAVKGIFVDNKIAKLKKTDWVPQYSKYFLRNPKLVSLKKSFGHKTNKKVCYHSLISYNRYKYKLREPEWYSERNSYYRETFQRTLNHRSGVGDHYQSTCKVKVVIVDRLVKSRRHIVDVDMLKSAIQREALNGSEHAKVIDVQIVYFEEMDFHSQLRCVQAADIIIGSHGAGMSNLVFATNGTSLIEIFPFSYYAGPFRLLAKSFFLQYNHIISEPDETSFLKCITALRTKLGSDLHQQLDAFSKKIWNESIYRWGNKQAELIDFSRLPGNFSGMLRYCSRYQNLRFDHATMLRLMFKAAETQCLAKL